MTEPSDAARLRRLFAGMTGEALENVNLDEMRRILREAGLPVEETTQVDALERRWRELQPAMLQAALDPDVDAYLEVEPVFQAALGRLGARAADPAALVHEPAGIRAIVATRLIDGLVENGGWTAVFAEGMADLLPVAVEGYGLLGLDEHASLAALARARGFLPPGPGDNRPDDPADFAFWEDLEAGWFDLPSPETARAAYIGAHPDIG
jgi:hypothetical protein